MSNWIVDGLIRAEHTVLLLGKPHNGKSWIANQLAVSAASGTEFCDLTTKPCNVFFIDEDSPPNVLYGRMHRFAKGAGLELGDLLLQLLCARRFVRADGPLAGSQSVVGKGFGVTENSHSEEPTKDAFIRVPCGSPVLLVVDSKAISRRTNDTLADGEAVAEQHKVSAPSVRGHPIDMLQPRQLVVLVVCNDNTGGNGQCHG